MTDLNKGKLPEQLLESVIEEKKSHIDEVIAPRVDKLSAKQEAYKRIVEHTKQQMAEYYEKYPERAVDDRGKDAEEESLRGLRGIFDILDDYIIAYADTAPAPPKEMLTEAKATNTQDSSSKEKQGSK